MAKLNSSWWFAAALLRLFPCIVFWIASSEEDNSNPNLASYALRVQQNHAQATSIPAMYLEPSIEIWIRSMSCISSVCIVLILYANTTNHLEVDSTNIRSRILILLICLSIIDALALLVNGFAYSTPHTYTNNSWLSFVLAAVEIVSTLGNLYTYILILTECNISDANWSDVDVQINFCFAIQSGFHCLLFVSNSLHGVHTLQHCRADNDEEACESSLMIFICLLIILMYFGTTHVLFAVLGYFSKDAQETSQVAQALWRQFSMLPPAVGLLGLDRNSMASTRIAGVAGVAAACMLVMAMASTLATFFDPAVLGKPLASDGSQKKTKGMYSTTGTKDLVARSTPTVHRAVTVVRRPVHRKFT